MTHLRGVKPALSQDRDPLTKAPAPPRYFSEFAKAEWRRVMPRLIQDRIITKADLGGVEDFCLARGVVREIDATMRTAGAIDLKLLRAQDKAMQTARQLAAEYGLSPTSRKRVEGQDSDNDNDDSPLSVGRAR
ncbi:MAG: P27 family phage terminase small subunit [Mesorhizobium sp.]|uniref:P27 family phage terminase small subunit n=1 Tax=Mesorhizobium sp. TaxID=1871066 RepID=UPI000FE540CC|nr:P27 family phage terminase small subunit [Mesorhizobium sp.]RWD80460.1 MAG: P27 family phage terminase small subunit [Mesorhizobium sp.]TIS37414.1 MAG: P27 family phage terminase small subunit [Mesorhizobium sp.]TIX66574.1 MAG: P27 family phage terminase small subunit [Mesorhizobium sp.]